MFSFSEIIDFVSCTAADCGLWVHFACFNVAQNHYLHCDRKTQVND